MGWSYWVSASFVAPFPFREDNCLAFCSTYLFGWKNLRIESNSWCWFSLWNLLERICQVYDERRGLIQLTPDKKRHESLCDSLQGGRGPTHVLSDIIRPLLSFVRLGRPHGSCDSPRIYPLFKKPLYNLFILIRGKMMTSCLESKNETPIIPDTYPGWWPPCPFIRFWARSTLKTNVDASPILLNSVGLLEFSI